MRHGLKINKLSRTREHRAALLRNLALSIITHKRIVTTTAKAKSLRTYVEPLLTKAKTNTTHMRRQVFARLQNKAAIKELFEQISPKISTRPGGYTRIIKLGTRAGDGADLSMIELVDYNTLYTKEAMVTTRKRTRRSSSKKVDSSVATSTPISQATTTELITPQRSEEITSNKEIPTNQEDL